MFSRSSALVWSRSIGLAALFSVIAGCSSAPQSSPITTPQPSPQSTESPIVAPQSVPSQPSPVDSAPESKPTTPNASRKVEKCVVRMARVNDPESPLNIRSSPNTTSNANIVGKLRNGSYVSIEDEQNGWYKISGETPGWIAKSKTESNCTEKIERVELGKDSIEITDRFIGAGSHKYLLNLTKGQKLTVTNDRDVFPMIVAPDGKGLTDDRENRKSWAGEVPATGDYAIVFDSNFKGYEYAISVEVR
jgi:hypothetical protein